jgi:hypothetical protein
LKNIYYLQKIKTLGLYMDKEASSQKGGVQFRIEANVTDFRIGIEDLSISDIKNTDLGAINIKNLSKGY